MTTWNVTRVWRNIEADTAMDALEAAPVLGHDTVNVRPADAAPYLAPVIAIARLTKERDQARANELQLRVAIDIAINLLWPGVNPMIARSYLVEMIGSDPIDARQNMSHWQPEIDKAVVAALVEESTPTDSRPVCKCGHPRAAHEHYRAGTDCEFNDCGCYKYREGS